MGSTCAPSAGELPGGELFFRRVIEGMRCAIVTVDREGRVLTVNELAREILELDNSIEIGAHVTKVLARHPRLAEVLLDALETRAATGHRSGEP